jgi:hypothetical protein
MDHQILWSRDERVDSLLRDRIACISVNKPGLSLYDELRDDRWRCMSARWFVAVVRPRPLNHVTRRVSRKRRFTMRFAKAIFSITLILSAALLPGKALKKKSHKPITVPEKAVAVKAPKSFMLDFSDAYIVYVPGSKGLQISAQGNVLSYGSDWQKCNLKPYLYHLRHEFSQTYYWKVNTSRREAYFVSGGIYCQLGGLETKLGVVVDVVGGVDDKAPERFFVRLPAARIIYHPGTKVMQLLFQDRVLSYCQDWQKCQLASDLYQLKQSSWKGFHWKVDTSRKEVYRIAGGGFCKPGGSAQKLKVGVRVID